MPTILRWISVLLLPLLLLGTGNARADASGSLVVGDSHSCVLVSDGTVRCWGRNSEGQLGDGSTTTRTTPVTVSGLVNTTALAAGGYHTCALISGGTVRCWGLNYSGQLGDGSPTQRNTPVTVSGLVNATALVAGDGHTCALIDNGTVRCWGYNYYGQLGDGSSANRYTPITVSGLANVTALAAGYLHTCAVIDDGTMRCWGYNGNGQLGDGSVTNRYTPVTVSGLVNATALAAGIGHTCAVLSGGTARCWGLNSNGQLGDGSVTNRYTPVTVSGLVNATAPAAGYSHSCALINDGTMRCWGRNSEGQLGDGSQTQRNTLVTVSGLVNATALAAGGNHTCGLINDGTVRCWGYNVYGQLGNGTVLLQTTPVNVYGTPFVVTYTLSYSAGPNGSISGSTEQTVPHGGSGTSVEAFAYFGYHFTQWDDGSISNPRVDSNVSASIYVSAIFEPDEFVVTASSVGDGQITPATQSIPYGSDAWFSVSPFDPMHYHVVGVSGDTCYLDDHGGGNWKANYINMDCAVTATFAPDEYYVYAITTGNGTITPLDQSVAYGLDATFSVTPDANHHVASVIGDTCFPTDSGSGTWIASSIGWDCFVVADFAIDTHTLSYTAGANGSITGTASQMVDHGSDGTSVTAVPNANYHFVNWSDGVTTAVRTDTNVSADVTVTANFAIDTYTLTYTAGADGTLTGASPQTVNYGASGSAMTALPNTGYSFVNWSDGSTANPRTDANVTANLAVTANFAIDTYTLTYTASSNGSMTGASPQTVNHGSDGTVVTAVANTNYHFVDWSDGSTANPRVDTNVTTNLAVTANFAIDSYTLTYTAGLNGSITGASPQTVNHGSDGTSVAAVPNANYHFVDWSDGSTANPRVDTNVTANVAFTANFAIDTYTLTYTAGANGSITGVTPQTVNHGTDGSSVTAVANANYHFVDWSDGSTANPRTDANVTVNVTVTANFAIDTYTLTYTAGANGSITGVSPQTVNHGSDGTSMTAVPNAHYHFVDWSDGSTANPRTDANVTTNLAVTANFAIDTYTLTYTASANGSITGASPQTVNHGSDGTVVTAVANANYHFVDWSDGSTTNPRTDTHVIANLTVTANFAIDAYTLAYTAAANGSITGISPQTVNHGSDGTAVTATPNANYHFVDWSDGSTANPRIDANVTANLVVTANFAIDTYTLTYTAGANGLITGVSPQTVNHGSDGSSVTAVANANYHFVDWSDGSTTNPRSDANVNANVTVTAHFAIDTYTLAYTAGANGSITGVSPQTVNHGSDGTSMTAVANANHHFVDWSDGSTANPRTDASVTANLAVTANFAIDTYTLTYTAGADGSITGASPQTINHGSDGSAVTAVANANYHFVDWSDGSTVNPRTDVNVTANVAVTANFAIDTHTLTYTAGANGSVTGTSPQTVSHGSEGSSVTAVPNANYHFVDWSDGSTANPRTDANVTANLAVTANFAIDTYTLTYTADANGSITGVSPQAVNHGSEGSSVTAVPNANHHFVDWSDGSTSNPRTDANVTANVTVTANFAIDTYTLTYTAGANGSITGASPQTVNHGSDGSSVTAVANANYHFVDWSDGSTANPRIDANVTANLAVTANFAIDQFTLNYSAGAHGTLSGNLSQSVDYGEDGSPVSADADPGYHFVQWSDASTSNPRTDSNVMANINVSASFANADPMIASVTATPATIYEAESSTITVTASDDESTALNHEFDCDNDGSFDVGPQLSASADCLFATPGNKTVKVRVTDEGGASATSTVAVTVNDSVPVVTLAPNASPLEDVPVALNATASVPSSGEAIASVDVDCDYDGATFSTDVSASSAAALSCPGYPSGGTRSIAIRATDDEPETGSIVTATINVIPVNDAPTVVVGTIPAHPALITGDQLVPGFASFDVGLDDEDLTQTIDDYLIGPITDPNGVLVGGSVDVANDGTLVYELSGTGGSAIVSIQVRDTGGTANGGNDTSSAQSFTITVGAAADLQVAKDNNVVELHDAENAIYAIVVANGGPNAVTDAQLVDHLPGTLINGAWMCVQASSTATCPTPGAGTGDLAIDVSMGVGEHLRFDMMADVDASAGEFVINAISISPPDGTFDPEPCNDKAIDRDPIYPAGIFADGFETPSCTPDVPGAMEAMR